MLIQLTDEQWQDIRNYAIEELKLSTISKADCDLSEYIPHYNNWIKNNYHADLDYMVKHGTKRFIPNDLIPGTNSVIVTTLNYLNRHVSIKDEVKRLKTKSSIADISIYAHGRDYHKVLKKNYNYSGNILIRYLTNMYLEFLQTVHLYLRNH